jgi:hypothetical protein
MRPDASSRVERLTPVLFVALVTAYLLPIARHPDLGAMLKGAPFTDLEISHLPNAVYVRDSY